MASLENLDEEALRAKLEEATSYEERAAIRQALRSLKKQRGEQVGGSKGVRRGASYYNRFAGVSRSVGTDKKPQSFVPTGPTSPAVTPLRSTSPASATRSPVQRLPTPTSPSSRISPDPSEEEEKRRQKLREIEEKEQQRREEQKQRERQMEEEEKARQLETEEERQLQRKQEEQEKLLQREQEEQEREHQQEQEEKQLQREEEEEQEREHQREEEIQFQREQEEQEIECQMEGQEKELEREEQGDEEGPRSPPSSPVDNEHEKEWIMVDKYHAHQLEREATALLAQEQTDGQGSSFGVQLRSTHSVKSTPVQKVPEPKAEFQQFQLRKTQSSSDQKRTTHTTEPISSSKSNFGVKLKSWELPNAPPPSTRTQRSRAQTYATSAGHKGVLATGARRTAPQKMVDIQHISSKAQGQVPPGASAQHHSSLVAYVNMALQLHPPLSSSSLALYETCSNPSLLCKLINKSVRNTVDLRALTRTPPPSQAASREEALQENMTLVVESARAIGCRVDDDMGQRILAKDPETIRTFLLDLIRARIVHMPGMDEEPASTFENVALMLEKLGISSHGSDNTDQPLPREEELTWKRDALERETEEPCPISGSWQAKATAISPPPSNQTSTASVAPDKPSLDANLTYEERAARRRAERERRRKEREALAVAK